MKIGTVALDSYDVSVTLESGVNDTDGRLKGMLCISNDRGWVGFADYSPAPSILKRGDARAMLNDAATFADSPEYASHAEVLLAITGYTDLDYLSLATEQPGIYP
jgi:hypothetical protein